MTEEKQLEDTGLGEEPKQETEFDDPVLLRAELDEILREKDQFRTIAQRAQADLINYRRRVAEDQESLRRTINAELVLKILSVVDDMDRALNLVPEDVVAPGWLDGLKLVRRNLQILLGSEGVTRIEAEGQRFEPWEHEAVTYEETPDGTEGMVLRVTRDGYKMHDKVLRAAQVAVSKACTKYKHSETKQQEA